MKVLVIYFSQSGGTEKIANEIREGIIKSGNSCDLVKIKKVDLTKLDEYDLIGLGCPTFFLSGTRKYPTLYSESSSNEGKTFLHLRKSWILPR